MKVGVDLMGGDTSPHVLFGGVMDASKALSKPHTFAIFCTQSVYSGLQHAYPAEVKALPLTWHFVSQEIGMGDNPATAVRHKKDSSLVAGVTALSKGEVTSFLTTGNTGALVAACYHLLPLKPGVKRPALMVTLKTGQGDLCMLDVGGTISNEKEHLINLTHLGVEVLRSFKGLKKPKVALLNIGTEPMKGTNELKSAYEHLNQPSEQFEFLGNIESKEVFYGGPDLVVTDGFTGNMFIKTAEGLSAYLITELTKQMPEGARISLAPFLRDFAAQFSQDLNPGAILVGIEPIVLKCHGATTRRAFAEALLQLVGQPE